MPIAVLKNSVKHFFEKLWIRVVITFAYALFAFERFFALPQYLFLVVVAAMLLVATRTHFDPFSWERIGLSISSQQPADYIRMMRIAHMFGDPLLAEQIYVKALPYLNDEQRMTFREEAYPQERLTFLQKFWSEVLQVQPTTREAYAALTLIHQSLQENEAFASTLDTWKSIEPNDGRIETIEKSEK